MSPAHCVHDILFIAPLQDLETSEDLAQKLNALFPEEQIYRQAFHCS